MLPSLDDELQAELDDLDGRDRLRSLPALAGPSRATPTLSGTPVVSFCSNDYLGLAGHPALARAAAQAAARSGFGAGAARLVAGDFPEHRELEAGLAKFVARPSALLFPSGYQANLAVLTVLAGPGDLIVADRAVHASLLDGWRLSRARAVFYPHLDVDAAGRLLDRHGPAARRKVLVTESLFSMDGDVAPLSALASLALAQRAALVVDEAHALGVLGPGGRGLCHGAGVQPDVLVGTLGKAFGASGGFVAGSPQLRALLVNRGRSFMFTTAPPPPVAAAALAALQLARGVEGQSLRASLTDRIALLAARIGLPGPPPSGPIVPILLGSDRAALDASSALLRRGLHVQAIRPPTVPDGTARLRITLSAAHRPEHVEALALALTALRRP